MLARIAEPLLIKAVISGLTTSPAASTSDGQQGRQTGQNCLLGAEVGLGVGLRGRLRGFLLGDDVVHLLFRFGHDMAGLLAGLVGSANGAPKRRFYGGAKCWQRFGANMAATPI